MMESGRCGELVDAFRGLRVLVVGDLYLDEDVFGDITGLSLEAPVPVYAVRERRHNAGAAGNVARNVAGLGGRVSLVAYVGEDANAALALGDLEAWGVDVSCVVRTPERPTNVYGKVKAGGLRYPAQQLLRMDTARPGPVAGALEESLCAAIRERAAECDAILVMDQEGAVCTQRVLETVVGTGRAHGVLTVGDSRERLEALDGFDVLAPNAREAGAEDDCAASVRAAGERLLERCGRAFISCGPRGIAVFERGMQMLERPSEVSRNEVGDVTGAGDTVTATVGLSLAAGASPAEAAELAMHAAGVVVRQRGVAPVTREALDLALAHQAGPPKLRTLEEAEPLVRRMQAAGKRVVWTNGCFDILHAGHIVYLQHAAAQGDVLIVGMNDDASVTALKGPGRPVVPEEERALVLAALACVDYVVPFGDPDTVPLLDRLRPDVYAKGGDYTLDTINQDERGLVEGYGGTIALLPGVSGRSTTRLIDRMRR